MKIDEMLNLEGFEWDQGNKVKNWSKHHVSQEECEDAFFNLPTLLFPDEKHSKLETRYYILGKTQKERFLFIVFTVRKKLIRVISARDMNNKERKVYLEKEKLTNVKKN